MKCALLGLGLAVVGCGGSSDKPAVDASAGGDSGGSGDGGTTGGTFTLTSTAFVEGAAIPAANSCAGPSPVLAWTSAPVAAKSFALTLIDPDANGFKHWVIYDIPTTTAALPAHVENVYAPGNVAGAHQTPSESSGTIGYYGPCPPKPPAHHYHFTVYALDVAALPGGSATTSATEAIAAITTHMIARAELTGTFTTQ